jgi:hypothetical protein
LLIILPSPLHTSRSDRAARSGLVRQDNLFCSDG